MATLKWKTCKTAAQAKDLIDTGVLLKWRELQQVRKAVPETEHEEIMRHLAVRLAERAANRLSFEIALETMLVWLANATDEKMLNLFLDSLFLQPNWAETCRAIAEIGLTTEVAENEHNEEIFAMAVVLTCEIGITIRDFMNSGTADQATCSPLLDHIATYLQSVSNSSSTCIRLSLLHYFGISEQHLENKISFNRVMGRFGHTVLDNLFSLLFNKKSEAVALQYLQENLPFVLFADSHSQRVLHETSKYFMLKNPERFALFLQTFSEHLMGLPNEYDKGRKMFVQHLGLLLKVASDVNHKQLAKDILTAISKFDSASGRDEVLKAFTDQIGSIRRSFKDLLQQVKVAMESNQSVESISQLRSSKRGRKPSFSRVDRVATINQVAYLANQEIVAKAG